MPTGYTAAILYGITFEEYAFSCARAFGALIDMRDDPMDKPIPEKLEPSDYHLKALEKAKLEFARLNDLPKIGWEKELEKSHAKNVKSHYEYKQKNAEDKAKYEAMLKKAKAYKAPSPEHIEYANFLVKQIEQSIEFDCGYWDKKEEPVKPDLEEYIKLSLKAAQDSIVYHNKAWKEDQDRTDAKNKWISQLRESLLAPQKK